jgi:hypothetical protein
VHWKSIRRKWNEIQFKNGYMKKWTEGNVRGDPNSTDIHSVVNTDDLAKYMVKYMLKNETGKRKIESHVWGCSPELTKMTFCIDEHDIGFSEAAKTITLQSEGKRLEHATLWLHRPLSKLILTPLIRSRLSDIYQTIKTKSNTQTYFTTE